MAFTILTSASTGTGSDGIVTTFQTKYNRDLLAQAYQLTVLEQFAKKEPFPKEVGATSMKFFRQKAGLSSEVSVLTEGTAIAVSNSITYDNVTATMAQYGSVYQFSDILGWTGLFNTMNGIKSRIAEVAALHSDDIVRNILASGNPVTGGAQSGTSTTYLNRMYAQGAATFAALNSAAAGAAELTVQDMLRAFTQLQINRAPKKNGRYYMVVPPQVAYNLMLDPKWLNIGFYQDKSQMVKGEVGQLYGVAIVVGTNPFLERGTGTEGTFDSTGVIATKVYDSFALGSDAFGTPIMAGNSPYNPHIYIVNTPDHADVLNQVTSIGWKAYWCAVTLNSTWGINIKARTSFA